MRTAVARAAVLALLFTGAPAFAQDSADDQLAMLADSYRDHRLASWERVEKPDGSSEASSRLPSVTPGAYAERARYASGVLAKLDAIDEGELSEKARVDAAVLRALLNEEIGDAQFREWEMPFDSDNNFWSYLAGRAPFQSVEDYERYISRMRDLPRYFVEQKANAREGLKRGFSVPRVTLQGRDRSLAAYVVDDPEKNPFWAPFLTMSPLQIPARDADRLRAEGREAIAQSVIPAYRDFLKFFREEYLPQTRETLAAEAMPDGPDYYQQQIRQYTTLDLTAAQIHQIGLDEVARITGEMEKVKAEAGFEGSLDQFVHFLRNDPQFVARTPNELMGVSAYVAKRVDGKIGD